MEYETEFYKLLKLAVTDDVALIRVLDKIMKLINNNSKDMRGIIDEDLKSELITYSVELIRNKKIYKLNVSFFKIFVLFIVEELKKLLLWIAH